MDETFCEPECFSVSVDVAPGYLELLDVLTKALDQAQFGKGRQRHANNKPFLNQKIMRLRQEVGSGYTIGQACKKAIESQNLDKDAAIHDLLGAIVYLGAEVLCLQQEMEEIAPEPRPKWPREHKSQ